MTAMNGMADVRAPEAALAISRLEDGFVNMRGQPRQLAESVVNEMMSAEADQPCEATGNGRSGYRERGLVTCVGTLAPRVPRLRTGSLFPDDATARVRRRVRGSSRPSSASGTPAPWGAVYHLVAIEMLGSCRGDAERILEEAEPDAPAYLDLPASHWRRPRANNVREGANGETRRRSRVAQVFPSVASPEGLAGAVTCGMDEGWQDARHFSKRRMDEPCDEPGAAGAEEPPTSERLSEWRLVAKRAADAGLEPADEMEAA